MSGFISSNLEFLLLLAVLGFGLFLWLSKYAKGEMSKEDIASEIARETDNPDVLIYLEDVLSNQELLAAFKEAA